MNSLSETEKKHMLKFLDKLSGDLKTMMQKQNKQIKLEGLEKVEQFANLVGHYNRFVSPRKVTGKLIDKTKNKFYYETEHFVGEIVHRQELFNKEMLKYLASMEKEIVSIKNTLKKK